MKTTISRTAGVHADVPQAALPAAQVVPADVVPVAPLLGFSLYQVDHQFYARAQ